MANPGKEFEKDFKVSVPKSMWFYRLRDGTASWEKPEKEAEKPQKSQVRFQADNICDIELYHMGVLALLELKSHKGKSLTHNVFKTAKGDIKHLPDLVDAAEHDGISAGAIINMRDVGETWYLPADVVLGHIYNSGIKSIPIAFMREKGYLIGSEKKITRYRYDVVGLMNHFNDGRYFGRRL
jgi:penicillin-binding protein-related factor A (putative recombinase)